MWIDQRAKRIPLVTSLAVLLCAQTSPPPVQTIGGTLASGAAWTASVPARWNGTLLLWSHGYQAQRREPEDAPAGQRQALLDAGYAIAGSNFAEAGWALHEAVPDQRDTLTAFTRAHGRPRRTIAWGASMGGLVTAALAEQPRPAIDGALALCSSIGGALGMMNMALDGAYAFRTLLAPESDIRLVRVDDDRVNAARVTAVLAEAQRTPEGRARVALAAVLAGIPGWTSVDRAAPAADDGDAQEAEMARAFVMGVFLPRTDQEARAGGVFSWNTGVDYRAQLGRSGRQPVVERLYRAAGLSLDADLARLNAGARIAANPGAVAYMRANYTPDAKPQVPLLAVQKIGDGQTSPSLQQAYLDAAGRAGDRIAAWWVPAAGHCGFDTATTLAAVRAIEARVSAGRWPKPGTGFIAYTPPPMLRPCVRGGACR